MFSSGVLPRCTVITSLHAQSPSQVTTTRLLLCGGDYSTMRTTSITAPPDSLQLAALKQQKGSHAWVHFTTKSPDQRWTPTAGKGQCFRLLRSTTSRCPHSAGIPFRF
ncbi:hypothetical protein BC835DRAFT_1350762 [Cytidiella melzeri]|nr:hypothetical protein BC835DRAFT_1350762 [Cytidiella melzeri]